MADRTDCCRYELSLDDLLDDDMMQPVLQSAGPTASAHDLMIEIGERVRLREAGSALSAKRADRTVNPGCARLGLAEHRAVVQPRDGAHKLRPSPLPGVLRLGSSRTKRSNTVSRSASGMPGPLSETSSAARPSCWWADNVTSPPPYLSALSSKLATACDKRWRSPRIMMPGSTSSFSAQPFFSATGS